MRKLLLFVLTVGPFIPFMAPAAETNWPQWRGPGSQGVSTERNLPLEWSENKNIVWKTPIPGQGFSSRSSGGRRCF